MNPGAFAETGWCYYCGELRCTCGLYEDCGAPVPAAHQNDLNAWVNADTGRIITQAKAIELLGGSIYGNNHAAKCKCWECEKSRSENDRLSEMEGWL